ncbi:MAG: DUF3592 domain-containing protein [Pirellulales bacterium]
MPRWFRLWEKKRGTRRTGSRLLGSVGEAMFFASLFFFGIISVVVLFSSIWQEAWPATTLFREATFTRATCSIRETRLLNRNEAEAIQYQPDVLVTVNYRGRRYTGWTYGRLDSWTTDRKSAQDKLDQYKPGWTCTCWFAANDPSTVILVRTTSYAFWILLLVLFSFVIIGGIGLSYSLLLFGTSAERRSALAKQAQQIDMIGDALPPAAYPTLPSDTNLTNSPGTYLAYRLPIEVSPGWWLFATLAFSLLWTAMGAVFLLEAIDQFVQRSPDWFLTAITIPVIGVGVWSIFHFLKQINTQARIGPTCLEISSHPLFPGKAYKLHFSQAGLLQVKRLDVFLVCDEEATYLQGTDVRTESARVVQQSLEQLKKFEITPGSPFEEELNLQIPVGSMHSFKSNHNSVQWKLEVHVSTNVAGKFMRSFPIVIYPERS